MNKIVFLFVFTMILAGCYPRRTVVSLTSPDMRLPEAALSIGNQTWEGTSDSANIIRFELENIPSGYAILQFGSVRKMIFTERGKDLAVRFTRVVNPGASRYSFEGGSAGENQYMEDQIRRKIFVINQQSGENDVIRLFNDSIRQRVTDLQSLGLSPVFTRLEAERQRYNILRSFSRYNKWDKALYPYLKEQLKENPELLVTEDYQAFLLDGLYAIGSEGLVPYTPHGHAKSQLEYIVRNIQDTTVADFALNSVLSRYMEKRGAEAIEELMDMFRQKVHSPRVKQSVEELYSKWNRVAKGKTIPEFTFLDVNDQEVSLSEFKGKYVYVDCWATWCGPCKQQLPALQQLEYKYKGKDIVFVSISSDSDRNKWKNMVKTQKLGGVQLIEKVSTRSEFSDFFMINAIPRFIVLDKEGKVFDMNAPRPTDPATTTLLDGLLE